MMLFYSIHSFIRLMWIFEQVGYLFLSHDKNPAERAQRDNVCVQVIRGELDVRNLTMLKLESSLRSPVNF